MSVTYLAKVEVAEDDISFASSSSNFDMIKKPSSLLPTFSFMGE